VTRETTGTEGDASARGKDDARAAELDRVDAKLERS
jgi:hypothetical protein